MPIAFGRSLYSEKPLRPAARCTDPIHLPEQSLRRGSISRLPAPVGKKNIPRAVDQEIAPALLSILFAVALTLRPLPQELQVKF